MNLISSTLKLGACLLFALALSSTANAQIFVANLGLNTISKYNLDGSLVSANFITGLNSPNGLVVSDAHLYVVNQASGTIGKYTTSGATVNASLISGLNNPKSIAVSGTDLYVANTGGGTIEKFTTSGVSQNFTTPISGQNPFGIAVSGTDLYVSFFDNAPRVEKYTTAGTPLNASLISFPAGTQPLALAVSGTDLYVMLNGSPGTVGKYTTAGVLINGSLVTGLTALGGIVVHEADLFVTAQGSSINAATIGQYTTSGGIVNATLVSGLNSAYGIAVQCNSIYEPYCITNLAGLALNSGTLDATGSAARFNQPWGVAVDGAGTAYVADTLNHTIRKITAGGVVTLLAGTPGSASFADGAAGTALFSRPTGVAVNSAGTVVYVADYNNHNIRKIDLTQLPSSATFVTTLAGSLTGVAGTNDATGSAAQFRNPFGVAVDGAANVFVSDQNNQTIRKITPGGVVTTYAGSPSVGGYLNGAQNATALFNTPRGIAVDSSGNVYVADSGNFTVRKISGGFVTTLAGHPFTPFLAGCDDGPGSGARFSALFVFSPFGGPTGVAVDSLGNVYVTDQGNHTIRKITPGGSVTTLAGMAPTSGSADGTGSAVRFNFPAGVAVDATGRLYVADTLNHTIRFQCPCDPAVVSIGLYAGLTIEGSIGCRYRVDYTTFLNPNPSLTVWTPLTTVTLSSSPFLYMDTTVVSGNRFYRVVPL